MAIIHRVYHDTITTLVFLGKRQQLIPALHKRIATLPERERERMRQIERRYNMRMDRTHPPTDFRIKRLQSHPVTAPLVVLTDEEFAAIERELAPFMQRLVVEAE